MEFLQNGRDIQIFVIKYLKMRYLLNEKIHLMALLSIALTNTAAFTTIYGHTIIGWAFNFFTLLLFIPMIRYMFLFRERMFTFYIFVMFLGFIFHLNIKEISFHENYWEVAHWIIIFFLLYISRFIKSDLLFYIVLAFFITECSIAIVERITENILITYKSDILSDFVKIGKVDAKQFRSLSLLGHPLNNANVVSLFMGFILINHRVKDVYKLILILLGAASLWAFNSRGALLIWLIILIFRTTVYEKKTLYVIMFCIIFFLTYSYFIEWIDDGMLGRLNFNLINKSFMTRINSFFFFYMQDWSFESILFGGRVVYMPGTKLLLENGILLNLSYWGWVVGSLKTLLEFIITYNTLSRYKNKEKFVILLSFWGVALMNNNIFNSLVLSFFLLAYAAFYVNDTFLIGYKSTSNESSL